VYSGGVSEEKNHEPAARSKSDRDRVRAPRVGGTRAAPTRTGSGRHRPHGATFGPAAVLPIMAVFLLIAGVGSALLAVRLHDRSVDAGSVSPFAPAARAVVIVVDGADPATLSRASMPNLRALRQNGVTYTGAWVGQMETTAAASAASIGTGSFPRVHGIVGDVWYDATSKRVTRATLPDNVLVGSIDTVMEPTGVDSIASEIKAQRPLARVLSVGGTNCGAAAAAGTWTADFVVCAQRQKGQWSPISVAGHELPPSATAALGVRTRSASRGTVAAEMQGWNPGDQDHWIARETANAMKATRPTLTFVNFPEIAILRHNVPPARAVGLERKILHGLDADIGRVVRETKRAGTYKSTIFVVTAGRAFEPIRARMSYGHLVNAIIAAGGEATYLTGDGAALIGLRDPLQAQPVAQALQAENSRSIDAVYFKTQSGNQWSYGAQYFDPRLSPAFALACSYLLSTVATTMSPDVVVVYPPFAGLASAGRKSGSAGALGLAWPIQHVPLILAGHGVYAGRTSTYPARLVDIAPTLETALGLQRAGSDGAVLRDALYGDTSGSRAQAIERAKLAPLTAALRSRAASITR
jgi:hypothetical protein